MANLTLNERMSWKRYGYLKAPNGGFYNQFDNGKLSNFLEFFHIKKDDNVMVNGRLKKHVDVV